MLPKNIIVFAAFQYPTIYADKLINRRNYILLKIFL
jgi:hypothetical protein